MKLQVLSAIALLSFVSAQDVDVDSLGGGGHGHGPGGGHHGPPDPFPGRKPISSKDLQKLVKIPNLLSHANKFIGFSKLSGGTRSYGTKGHNATVAYIKKVLDQTGFYHTEYQSFPHLFEEYSANFTAGGKSYSTGTFEYSPSANISAPLVAAKNLGCESADYPSSVSGQIVVVKRGDCQFGQKVALAGAAGAAGAILYNNVDAAWGSVTLSTPSRPEIGPYVPVGGISLADGEALVASLAAGSQITGSLRTLLYSEDRYSSNLIATTKVGNQKDLVVLGAHSDSVPAGPGINDNGSGSISILELALNLPKFTFKNAVRFAWWTAEEEGLIGSKYYVAHLTPEESAKIALYLNFDMTASPNAGQFILDGDGDAHGIVGPPGSDHIEHTFQTYYNKTAPVRYASSAFSGRSDYGPFLTAGIPAGGLQTGAEGIMTEEQAGWWNGTAGVAYDKCYHSACDTVENLNLGAWLIQTKGAAHALASYSASLQGIPRNRTAPVPTRQAAPGLDCRGSSANGCVKISV